MNKIYWWCKLTHTEDTEYRDLDLLNQFISEGRFVYLSFEDTSVELLLSNKTRANYQPRATDETLSISNFWCQNASYNYSNFTYATDAVYYVNIKRPFKFKEITKEEYNNLINR